MKNDKTKPWNDPKAPMQKNGAKWAIRILIGITISIGVALITWAAILAN